MSLDAWGDTDEQVTPDAQCHACGWRGSMSELDCDRLEDLHPEIRNPSEIECYCPGCGSTDWTEMDPVDYL